MSEVKGEKLVEITQGLLKDEISEHIVERLIDVLSEDSRTMCRNRERHLSKVFETAHRRPGWRFVCCTVLER